MTEDADLPRVARAADRCTEALRTARFTLLDQLVTDRAQTAGLAMTWAQLLVTLAPEEQAADLVDELWRRDDGAWLIAVEYFLDYAYRRDPVSLRRFGAEVASWPAATLTPFARLVVAAVSAALPDGLLPSHYLTARRLILDAAGTAGCPELSVPLAGLVALGRRAGEGMEPALDFAYHVERELPETSARRKSVAALALVVGGAYDPGEPIVVPVDGGGRVLTDRDDPAAQSAPAERATVLAARLVRHAGTADLAAIESELLAHAPDGDDLVAVLLALALATAAQAREETPIVG